MIKHSVILLKRDHKRFRNVKNNIQNLIPSLNIFDAFDYKKESIDSFCLENDIKISNTYKETAKIGGIANIISHVKLWKEMVKDNTPEMVILEDDAKINSGHLVRLQNVKKELPKEYSLCLLYTRLVPCVYGTKGKNFKSNVKGSFGRFNERSVKLDNKKYINKGHKNYGMVSYLISLSGAKKMLKEFKNISHLIDVQINQLIKNTSGHNIFCAKNPFVSMNILPTNVLKTDKIKNI